MNRFAVTLSIITPLYGLCLIPASILMDGERTWHHVVMWGWPVLVTLTAIVLMIVAYKGRA